MQASSTSSTRWYFIPQDSDFDLPSRISVQEPFRIGRREGFELCLDCRNVSGLHAEVLVTDGKLYIEDLSSTNGTFVNGDRIRSKTLLEDHDEVQIGQLLFTVSAFKNDNRAQTMLLDTPSVAAETTEERFARLLVDGVVPFFQPICKIDGDEQEVVGYEVLGRSRLFGLKTPDQMFAVATDLAKESELSRILRLRGLEAAQSSLSPDLQLFVNTHPSELDCEEIQQSLKIVNAAFPEREIMLELPESVLYNTDDYKSLFETARELGVKITVFDFGAGQIRLAELSRIKPDVVKFDCALTQGIDSADEDRKRLVSAMVHMTTELGITPMAEYVETEQEHETLREMGFQLAQGFYYGHPKSIDTFQKTVNLKSSDLLTVEKSSSSVRPIDIIRQAELDDSDIELCESELFEESAEAIEDVDAIEKVDASFEASDAEEEADLENAADSAEATGSTDATVTSEMQVNNAAYLLDLNSNCYTLQLMFGSTEKAAREFVAAQTEQGDYSIYRRLSAGREWFVVVFNQYDNIDAVTADKKVLFKDSEHSCWVRKISDVKKEIRSVSIVGSNA